LIPDFLHVGLFAFVGAFFGVFLTERFAKGKILRQLKVDSDKMATQKETYRDKQNKFPDRKDMTYWLIVMVMLLIFTFVLNQNNPTLVNSKLSLLGTLTSIALAIIAIIFSFIQSNSSSNQLREVAMQTSKIVSNLSEVTRNITSLEEVKEAIEEYNEVSLNKVSQIESMLNKISTDISESTTENFREIKDRALKEIKQISQDDIATTITVSNPNYDLVYKTIIEDFKGVDIHEQVLWKTLFDKGFRLNLKELKEILCNLEQEGKIIIIKNTFVRANI